jgi:hypothetical protein
MIFAKENYGLTFSLLVLLGLLISCNIFKFINNNLYSERFNNNSNNSTKYYCPNLQKNINNDNKKITTKYCPGVHPSIPYNLIKKCKC